MKETDQARIKELLGLKILDTKPEAEFDRLAFAAAAIAQAPMALISFLDEKRQWFKARVGLDSTETPLTTSFCTHAIQSRSPVFEITDALCDDRFKDFALVIGRPNIRFYAGAPIRANGIRVGTICILDDKPRENLTSDQRARLIRISEKVSGLLERR